MILCIPEAKDIYNAKFELKILRAWIVGVLKFKQGAVRRILFSIVLRCKTGPKNMFFSACACARARADVMFAGLKWIHKS